MFFTTWKVLLYKKYIFFGIVYAHKRTLTPHTMAIYNQTKNRDFALYGIRRLERYDNFLLSEQILIGPIDGKVRTNPTLSIKIFNY